MRVPTVVLTAVTHLVAVVGSFLLVLVFAAALPLGVGSVVLLGMIAVLGVVAGGVLEGPVVRLAARASVPTDSELYVLSAVPDLGHHWVLVCRNNARSAAPVVIIGPFTVVSVALVEALHRGKVSTREATALVVHARAHHHVVAPCRGEVAIVVAEMPGRMVVGVFRGLGRAFAWMPLGSRAWRLRGAVGVVCLAQSVAQNRTWPGVLGAVVIALTYLVSAGVRGVEARATSAGDAAVVGVDLGGVLVEVLDRGGRRLSMERRQRLQANASAAPSTVARPAPEGAARHLHLVRS